MPRADLINLSGKTFGAWRVLEFIDGNRYAHWLCECVCGTRKAVKSQHLRSGASTNCGCVADKAFSERLTSHGLSRTSLYKTWTGMKGRCYNSENVAYPDYGGRGIRVCDRWLDSFEAFASDMGKRPEKTSLGRVDNEGDYTPDNCRWETRIQQNSNTRRCRWLEFNGERMLLKDWALRLGVKQQTLIYRLSKYPVEVALSSGRHERHVRDSR